MYTTTDTARPGGIRTAFRRTEAWFDQRGRWAWITLLVLLFVIAWPVALVLLAYMIWEKRMFAKSCGTRRFTRHQAEGRDWSGHAYRAAQPTGNFAFDNYKAEALRRLEEEQAAFEAFLQRLRNSKDKSEFDAFMDDRARATSAEAATEAATAAEDATAQKPSDAARPGEY